MAKVLHSQIGASSQAKAFFTFASPVSELWLSFRMMFNAAALGDGDHIDVVVEIQGDGDTAEVVALDTTANKQIWTWWSGSPIGAAWTADTWRDIVVHVTAGTPMSTTIAYDGVDIGAIDNSGHDVSQFEGFIFGWDLVPGTATSGSGVYFDDIKASALSSGGNELFDATFEAVSIVPPFDSQSVVVSGVLEVIDDPFPAAPASSIEGVSVAFGDTMLEPDPTWTRIDNQLRVSRWEIRRGRQDEREKTEPAQATVFVNDVDGLLDPTNTGSPWFGVLDGRQLALARWNPVTGEWFTRFRGTIEEYGYDLHPSQSVTEVAIRAVGFMGYLARAEMAPGAAGFSTTLEGGILYEDAEVNDRIDAIHGDAGIPPALTVTFSGNVVCDESRYPPGYSFLAALFDAADAEFAGVSNVYEDRFGRIVFHGRHARFDPQTVADDAGPDAWDFHVWKAGDEAAIVIDPTTAQIRPPLQYDRSLDRVINAGLATPQVDWVGSTRNELTAAQIQANIVTDPVSIGKYGVRSWSAPDLHIKEHKTNGNSGLEEAFNQASYYVTNNADPVTRPRQITFKSLLADDYRASATWGLICEVDISDVIHLTVTNPGGGGFDDDYYVEGITETSTFSGPFTPSTGEYDNAELTVDVSPEAWYTEDPFNDEGS